MTELELRPAAQWFAQQMEAKLRTCDYRAGRDGLTSQLFDLLEDEWIQLWNAFYTGLEPEIIEEAVDMANLCMILADAARTETEKKETKSDG